MAISSYQVYLMKKASTGDTYEKYVDIKDFPDLGGTPEMLETTTLSDPMTTNIPGIQSLDSLAFTCNYDAAKYQTIKADQDSDTEFDWAVYFGAKKQGDTMVPDGHNGIFKFKGKLSVYASGGGVNEVVNMTVTIASSTPITFSLPT